MLRKYISEIMLGIVLLNMPAIVNAENIWTQFTTNTVVNDYVISGEYVWTATSHGVVRYNINDKTSEEYLLDEWGASLNRLSIETAGDGLIGVATEDVFSVFDGTDWHSFSEEFGPRNITINDMEGKGNGEFWFHIINKDNLYYEPIEHIFRYCDGIVECMDPEEPTFTSDYKIIHEPETNEFWIQLSLYGDAYRYSDGGWTVLPLDEHIYISSLTVIDGNVEFVNAAYSRKIYHYVSVYKVNADSLESYATHGCTDMFSPQYDTTTDGKIWVAENGLHMFDGEEWTTIPPESYGDGWPYLLALKLDNAGNVYTFSSSEYGTDSFFARYDGTSWLKFTGDHAPPSPITAFCTVDTETGLWVTTQEGLAFWDGGLWHGYQVDENISNVQLDDNGNLWYVTSSGLYAIINGIIEHYGDKTQIASNYVEVLEYDSSGQLWVGTDNGISYYDGISWNSFFAGKELPGANDGRLITSIIFDKNGDVWAGTWGSGILHLNGEIWEQHTFRGNADFIHDLVFHPDGSLWAATNNCVMVYDGNEWETYFLDTVNPHVYYSAIVVDSSGDVWVSSNSGLFRYHNDMWEHPQDTVINCLAVDNIGSVIAGISNGILKYDGEWSTVNLFADVLTIYASDNGELWAGSSEGLVLIDGQNRRWMTVRDGLPRETITDIAMTPDGKILCGFSDAGIARLDISEFYTGEFTEPSNYWIEYDSLWNEKRLFICRNLLFTAGQGMSLFDINYSIGERFEYTNISQYTINDIGCIPASSKFFWLGTTQGLILYRRFDYFNGEILENFHEEDGMAYNYVRALSAENESRVWVINDLWSDTYVKAISHVSFWDGEKFTVYTETEGLPAETFKDISYSEAGVFVLTDSSGIYRFNNGMWDKVILDETTINSLCPDGNGGMWFGSENGILHYDNGDIEHFTVSDGVPSDIIDVAVVDDKGLLWCTYPEGVADFNGTNWEIFETPEEPIDIVSSSNSGIWVNTENKLLNLHPKYILNHITSDVIVENTNELPEAFSLSANYPNPFNQSTRILCTIPSDSRISVEVYNILGQRIRIILDEYRPAGTLNIAWDGRDEMGNEVTSGVYFLRVIQNNQSNSQRMLLLR